MLRLAAALVSLAVASSACLPTHAPAARRVGMVASVAGVLGLMATAAVQSYTNSDEMLAAFSLMSGGGIVVFAMGELSLPPKGARPETETEKLRRWARILTSRASGAAREGRCPRVRRLEKRVNVYDREVHDFVFMRDAEILRCLGTVPQGDPDAADQDADAPAPVLLPAPPGAAADPVAPPSTLSPPRDPGAPRLSPAADPEAPPPLPPPRDPDAPPTLAPPPADRGGSQPPPQKTPPLPPRPPTFKLPPGTVLPRT
jgi:hypothetical protein